MIFGHNSSRFFRIQDPDPQHFSKDMVRRLMNSAKEARAFDGNNYVPGVVGLNNIKEGPRLLRKPILLFIYLLKVYKFSELLN